MNHCRKLAAVLLKIQGEIRELLLSILKSSLASPLIQSQSIGFLFLGGGGLYKKQGVVLESNVTATVNRMNSRSYSYTRHVRAHAAG
jgi:hypothetical protein